MMQCEYLKVVCKNAMINHLFFKSNQHTASETIKQFLMVSALVPGAKGPGSSPGQGHCVVFLGKTLTSHSASLHPGVLMGTGKLLGKT